MFLSAINHDCKMSKDNKESCIHIYPDGGSYLGCIKDGKRHGNGSMTFSNYDTYEGCWSEGNMEGYGIYHFYDPDTDKFCGVYKGLFHKNLFEGYGELEIRKESYRGFWKENMRNGEGISIFQDGSCFHGLWKDDHIVQGELLLGNGDRYAGQFSNGIYNGNGKYFWKGGDWFVGLFKEGRPIQGIKVKTSGEFVVIDSSNEESSNL